MHARVNVGHDVEPGQFYGRTQRVEPVPLGPTVSRTTIGLPGAVRDWLLATSPHEHPALRRLRHATTALPEARMQISPEQGHLLRWLVQLTGTRRVLEIGTFTGYSALAMALGLPDDGKLVACDVSDEWTSIGRSHWADAGVAERIEVRIGPALDTLEAMKASGEPPFDLAFIDADKVNYRHYVDHCIERVRPGGLILVDNVLWGGSVADASNGAASTRAIRAVSMYIARHPRLDAVVVPIGDGLTAARVLAP